MSRDEHKVQVSMVAVATDSTPDVASLSDRAFEAFCEDMTGMFDVELRCARRAAAPGQVQDLREHFKKLAAVHSVRAEGTLNGSFHLLFDPGGVFVLGGVIVMLPEPRIREGLKRCSLQDADSLQDAAREAGNLLVGSWDRVFRADCPGHKHFVKSGTFIGKPWEASGPQELQSPEPVLTVLYEMTVEPYPSFVCAAVFPTAILPGAAGAVVAPPPDRKTEAAGPKTGGSAEPVHPVPAAVAPQAESPGAPRVEAPAQVQTPPPPRVVPAPSPQKAAVPFLDPTYIVSAPPSESPARAPGAAVVPCDRALTGLLEVPVAQIMQKDVVWTGPDETVQDVIARMQQHNTGYVLVGQKGALEGLVSSSNILGAVSLYLRPLFAQWRRPEDDATLGVKIKWIMSRPVRTIRPDATVAAGIESLRRCGGRCLPVVDAAGSVQGIVTVFDILLRLLEVQGQGSWQGRPPQAPALLL